MFDQGTFVFLSQLAQNNTREWFEINKSRYEDCVREPALDFVEAMEPVLQRLAPHFRAEARKAGGSLMRVHRDVRFSRDKRPYKTNIGIQFRHLRGRDVHAPGFYVHIEPGNCFLGVGCWHPEAAPLGRIRDLIACDVTAWLAARDDRHFTAAWRLGGDALTRIPRGYDAKHAAAEDIRRKDFIALSPLTDHQVIGGEMVRLCEERFGKSRAFMQFLCRALELEY